jgi:hypothetical protein
MVPLFCVQVAKFLMLLEAKHSMRSTRADATLQPDDSSAPSESVVVPLGVLLVGAAAAVFLCVMLRDQLPSLLQGVAKIDRLQQLDHDKDQIAGGTAESGAAADVPTAAAGATTKEETVSAGILEQRKEFSSASCVSWASCGRLVPELFGAWVVEASVRLRALSVCPCMCARVHTELQTEQGSSTPAPVAASSLPAIYVPRGA